MTKDNRRRRLTPEARRNQILKVAEGQFADKPYEQVTISSIARGANVSSGLVYRYFNSKEDLHVAVLKARFTALRDRREEADEQLAAGVPVRDRVRTAILIYLDFVENSSAEGSFAAVPSPTEPIESSEVRAAFRQEQVEELASLLGGREDARGQYAVEGFFGFLDSAVDKWRVNGCLESERYPLVDAALGALEGSLGDWGA